MDGMDEYICSYYLPDDEKLSYFRCWADDLAHAKEQLLDAEPQAKKVFCEIYERNV